MNAVNMTAKPSRDRMAGLRFAYLIRQLIDDGIGAPQIAAAIGCDVSLISKWRYRGSSVPHDLTRKGLRDDVIQGIYDGLGVRSDYLFMPTPKGYPNQVRLRDGSTRPCQPGELDHKDFRVVTNVELEQARDRKERAAQAAKIDALEQRMSELTRMVGVLLERDTPPRTGGGSGT